MAVDMAPPRTERPGPAAGAVLGLTEAVSRLGGAPTGQEAAVIQEVRRRGNAKQENVGDPEETRSCFLRSLLPLLTYIENAFTDLASVSVQDYGERVHELLGPCWSRTRLGQRRLLPAAASAARGRLTTFAISKKIVYIAFVQEQAVQQCPGPVLGTDMRSVINPQL